MTRGEARQPVLVVLVGGDGDEHRHLGVDLGGIEHRHARLDDAVLLHLLDAPPAGRGRQPDAAADLRHRHGGVLLQDGQDHAVEAVHGERPSELGLKLFSAALGVRRQCCAELRRSRNGFLQTPGRAQAPIASVHPSAACWPAASHAPAISAILNHTASRNLNGAMQSIEKAS